MTTYDTRPEPHHTSRLLHCDHEHADIGERYAEFEPTYEESRVQQRHYISLAGLAAAVLMGCFLGAGGFTFHYGEGWSYFSDAPEACINCHIMQPHYDTWVQSSHGAATTCVDCHLPVTFPHSLLSKADNGFFHSWAFTFEDFHEPIQIKPRNLRILEDNCVRCHQSMVAAMLAHAEPLGQPGRVSCLHCHADVGHTARPRLYARWRAGSSRAKPFPNPED